jgi:predicted 2-oxoglutarate/Fe(II)-dependent dioxygenase YbiX
VISKNIRDYVKVYKDFIEPGVCKSAVERLSSVNWQMHTYYNSLTGTDEQYDHELSISHDDIPERNMLNKLVWDALHKYVIQDLKDFHEWFAGWNGFTYVRFNKYDPTTEMKLHCDHIHSMFDGQRKGVPVLTVLGSLNNEYTGGEFVMWEDEVIDLPAGAIAVFPSNFLYPHEVRPVKTGVRYSFVSWAW